ncbi:hypothetical protein SISNIDRAFT_451561, partial [Sistotremastrum niveocremeum HHB9708]
VPWERLLLAFARALVVFGDIFHHLDPIVNYLSRSRASLGQLIPTRRAGRILSRLSCHKYRTSQQSTSRLERH